MSGPGRARKRPREVDFFHYDGTNADEAVAWAGDRAYVDDAGQLVVRTRDGEHVAEVDDRIVIGLVGEIYQVRPDAWDEGFDDLGPG